MLNFSICHQLTQALLKNLRSEGFYVQMMNINEGLSQARKGNTVLSIKEEDGGRDHKYFQDYIDSIYALKKKYAGTADLFVFLVASSEDVTAEYKFEILPFTVFENKFEFLEV